MTTECVICQIAIGEAHEGLLNLTASHHAEWAHRHRCGYVNSTEKRTDRPPAWEKIPEIRVLMEDWPPETLIVMMDADTLCMRPQIDPRSALDLKADVGLVWCEAGDLFNSGVIFARNRPNVRAFFEKVWELGPLPNLPEWWEEGRIHSMLDMASLGRHMAVGEIIERCGISLQRIGPEWNTYKWIRCGLPVIQAWHSEGVPVALAGVKAGLLGTRAAQKLPVPQDHGGWGAAE